MLSLQMDDGLRDKGTGDGVCLVAYQPRGNIATSAATEAATRGVVSSTEAGVAAAAGTLASTGAAGQAAGTSAPAGTPPAAATTAAAATTVSAAAAATSPAATTPAAVTPMTPTTSTSAQEGVARSHPFGMLRCFVRQDVQAGVGGPYTDAGLLGAAICDTFGNLIPPRTLDPVRDGAFGWIQRQGRL